jgi:hypothetical protein
LNTFENFDLLKINITVFSSHIPFLSISHGLKPLISLR